MVFALVLEIMTTVTTSDGLVRYIIPKGEKRGGLPAGSCVATLGTLMAAPNHAPSILEPIYHIIS